MSVESESPLGMSDEAFLEASFQEAPVETEEAAPEVIEEPVQEESAAEGEADDVVDEVVEEPASEDPAEAAQEEPEAVDEEASDDPADEPVKEDSAVDYESAYKKIFAPFKANGKDIQIESPEDAVQLMQMGANYNKKMAALKPSLKILKLLENHGLLAEDKLSYLIDLERKDPSAVKKLIKDSKLDLQDLEYSDDESTEYKPKTYTVNDNELALDAVLSEIESTSTYNDTVELVGTKWDDQSREVVVKNPQIMKVINEHMQNGLYAQISAVVERDKMLGRLNGISDLEAYRQVGDRLHAEGKFNQPAQSAPVVKPAIQPQVKKPDPKVVERKRAAAPTKSTPTATAQPSDFNPLALSDEDFEKQFSAKYL